MNGDRDLARNDLWHESIERSRERRVALRRRRGRGRGGLVPVAGALLVLVAVIAALVGSGGGSRAATRPRILSAQGGPTYANLVPAVSRALLSGAHQPDQLPSCRPQVGLSDYFNPLAAARVTPERVDQGVDYAGSGGLGAIGAARITYVGTSGTGWPGAFIEYRLLDGTDAGCYVYYAEGVEPAPGLRSGQIVGPGQPVASIIPGWSTGIELGWGAGVKTVTYAAAEHQWSARSDADSIATAAGKSFSGLVAALGGPAGRLEG